MDKRGQFYLIIAVIISLAIYGITYKVNTIQEPELWEDFNDVSENYLVESTYVVNLALRSQEDVQDKLDGFTRDYLDYAKKRDPDLNLLYIYSNGTNISVQSYLDSASAVQEYTVIGGNQELVQDVTIRIGGKEFIYKVPINSENFGEGWNGVTLGNVPFNLSVAGILLPYNLSSGSPEVRVLIRTQNLEDEAVIGSGDWSPLLSPGNIQQFTN